MAAITICSDFDLQGTMKTANITLLTRLGNDPLILTGETDSLFFWEGNLTVLLFSFFFFFFFNVCLLTVFLTVLGVCCYAGCL